jgi:hypothetical protein
MSSIMRISDSAVPFILLQRTHYLRLPRTLLYRALNRVLPISLFECVVGIESAVYKRRAKRLYESEMREEYESIKHLLPNSCAAMLDIGCGIAGIDVLLSRHYALGVMLHLLDKTEVARRVYYGFNQKAAFYNSLSIARDLLLYNGVPGDRIRLHEATAENEIPFGTEIDLVISFISWGFHYPVSTYLDRVHDLLSEGGRLILDVRKGSDGLADLERRFGSYQVILEREKYDRILCIKSPSGRDPLRHPHDD